MVTTRLERTTFRTSRLLEFCNEKELVNQTGHEVADWPLVIVKELVDNALDACEEAEVAPEVTITVDTTGISVADNGPGLPVDTMEGVLDYTVRASSREAYVAPDRGAQGNALKTILPMPYVLSGGSPGVVEISTGGECHEIEFSADPIRQEPVIKRRIRGSDVKSGTEIRVHWPDSACSILADARLRFLQIAEAYTLLNPHLTLAIDWFDISAKTIATNPAWKKWRPSDPTCPHWYEVDDLERIIAAYIAHDQDHGTTRSVREFVREFRGLTGSVKQKRVLDETGLARVPLSDLANGDGLRRDVTTQLLESMQTHTQVVKATQLGVIGRDHLAERFEDMECDMDSFAYKRLSQMDNGVPMVIESAFAWKGPDSEDRRRMITGVTWSASIENPFRSLGNAYGDGLAALLAQRYAGPTDPIVVFVHVSCPRVRYRDRGKTSVILN
jgi:DNA topoisomerase VI subunit B